MTTLFNCALNGIPLASLDDRMCILDICEDAPRMHAASFSLPGGGRRISQVRESLTLHIRFSIQEENPVLRKQALQSVYAWAADGGTLTVSDRPGQQLTVICTDLPAVTGDNWQEALTLTFTTTHCPYWEDVNTTFLSGSGPMSFTLPGTASSAPVSATITNIGSQDVTRLSVQCGANWIIFEDICLPAGGKAYLQMKDGRFSTRINGESILPCRTAGSADLLLAPCGAGCIVSASADQALEATFSARGRYA